ncbi:hypothetical protein [Paenibacillus thiaminolyticus]|uniref:Uncharacterized protein n=1 Tax=Paenibacillus thiaminolyticus TaxID=49283 RepID=A0A3A3GA51_PANTH|nr:hypothetical protein [Paenibacillus thiaminolyticus]RJG19147.1 hypothetical protein DQX05_26150 [Paenibacillus thiaminolyticus]
MKKMNKSLAVTAFGAILAVSAMGSAFAAEADTTLTQEATAKPFALHKERGINFEQLAAEKGITVDELKAQMEQEREAKLEQMAAEKGITVDELKEQMKERGTKGKFGQGALDLEQLAAEKGITVDELKAQMEQERKAKLDKLASE